METAVRKQYCPICKVEVGWSERYPAYLCGDCMNRAVSPDGRPVVFGNASINGGLVATYLDSRDAYLSDFCFVDGVECRAQEARFGGVVIMPTQLQNDSVA